MFPMRRSAAPCTLAQQIPTCGGFGTVNDTRNGNCGLPSTVFITRPGVELRSRAGSFQWRVLLSVLPALLHDRFQSIWRQVCTSWHRHSGDTRGAPWSVVIQPPSRRGHLDVFFWRQSSVHNGIVELEREQ